MGDCENLRIQVFTADGRYLREMPGYSPYGLFITADARLFVVDGKANKVYKMTLTGQRLASWGGGPDDVVTKELGKNFVLRLKQGAFSMPHAITVGLMERFMWPRSMASAFKSLCIINLPFR